MPRTDKGHSDTYTPTTQASAQMLYGVLFRPLELIISLFGDSALIRLTGKEKLKLINVQKKGVVIGETIQERHNGMECTIIAKNRKRSYFRFIYTR